MVTHIVLLRLRQSAELTPAQIGEALSDMSGRIPHLDQLEVGVDDLRTERSYDVSLIARFGSWDDARNYQDHPVHRAVLEKLSPSFETTAVVDYES